ncbi:hypothetical protein I546_2424 [Mycobacterium kansasii 732]|nr:hypothetical protein I546_2424 [Mycobacterium kansasii 732]
MTCPHFIPNLHSCWPIRRFVATRGNGNDAVIAEFCSPVQTTAAGVDRVRATRVPIGVSRWATSAGSAGRSGFTGGAVGAEATGFAVRACLPVGNSVAAMATRTAMAAGPAGPAGTSGAPAPPAPASPAPPEWPKIPPAPPAPPTSPAPRRPGLTTSR